MSFKIKKIHYTKTPVAADDFFPVIKKKVGLYFAVTGQHRHASNLIWVKATVLILLAAAGYTAMLVPANPALIVCGYILFGWVLLLMSFNLAHDAAHGCLTGNKRRDNFIFELLFGLQGANAYLWKIRHIYSHHPYPNVEGCDADIELTTLLRFSEQQPRRWFHRYQHVYAPFLYSIYTLYWIFYKDIILFVRQKQANIQFTRHPMMEWFKLIAVKLVYLFLFLGLPVLLHPSQGMICRLAFLLMHFLNSLFLLFTFLISHHVLETQQPVSIHNGNIEHNWAMQQVLSSADFHAEQKWAYWLFGGFNAHVAHHLFPGVCHVHYPAITGIIRKELQRYSISYHSFAFGGGIRSHLKLLYLLGKRQTSKKMI